MDSRKVMGKAHSRRSFPISLIVHLLMFLRGMSLSTFLLQHFCFSTASSTARCKALSTGRASPSEFLAQVFECGQWEPCNIIFGCLFKAMGQDSIFYRSLRGPSALLLHGSSRRQLRRRTKHQYSCFQEVLLRYSCCLWKNILEF